MKNYDDLIRKVELFERLALYGSRKSFLQSLSQAAATPLPADVKQQIETVLKDFGALGIEGSPFYSTVFNAVNNADPYAAVDVPTLISALQQATTFYPRDHVGQLSNLRDLINKLQGLVKAPEQVAGPTTPTTSTARPGASPAAYDPETVKLLQTFLASALGSLDVLGPAGIDGKMGNYTIKALQQWAAQNGVKGRDVKDLMNIALKQSKYK